jgi:3-hydroxymyristoyl/3-hydroxydecanoyl-(acyl carrier protein) dehydratase
LKIIAFEKTVEFPKHHPAVQGHFEGRPIVPGVTLLASVIRAILSECPQFDGKAYEVVSAKFLFPVEPAATILIQCVPKELFIKPEQTRGQIEFAFNCLLKSNLDKDIELSNNITAIKGAIRFAT